MLRSTVFINRKTSISLDSFSELVLKVLVCFSLAIILVETINGFFIYKGLGSLSNAIAALKLGITLFLMYVVACFYSNKFIAIVSIISIAFFLVFIHHIVGSDDDLRSVVIIFKILANFSFVYFLFFVLQNFNNGFELVKKIILFNFSLLVFNIFLGAAGIGFANYTSADETAIGGTGFLYAGNEVGVALLLAVISMLVTWGTSKVKIVSILAVSFLASLFVLSKVTLIGILFSILTYLFFTNKLLLISFCSILFISAVATLPIWLSYFQLAINRWVYLLNSYGVEAFILGGHKRVDYIGNYLNYVADNPSMIFIGLGWVGEAENNFFDMLEGFGVLGICIFIIFSRYMLHCYLYSVKTIQDERFRRSFKTTRVVVVMAIIVAILAGHTIQSSLITPFFGFVSICYFYIKQAENRL